MSVDEFFFQDENFAKTVDDDEKFKNDLQFSNSTGGYGSCKIGGDLIDRKVSHLVAEEWVELCDIFEYRYNFGHKSADILVVFAVR